MSRRAVIGLVGLVGLVGVGGLLGAGCDPDPPAGDQTTSRVGTATFPARLNRALDVLFVVDDSGATAEWQTSLAQGFPAFVAALSTVEGGLPDVHIGVVSSNVGTGGVALGGCSTATEPDGDDGNLLTNNCAGLTAAYLEDLRLPDGTRLRNYTGELATVFSCMAQLGTGGCNFEAHLESAYRALQPGKNPGFLRPAADLAVIILGDEDDCSALPGGALFGDPMATIASPLGPRTSFRCWEFGVACDDEPNPRAFGTYTGCRPRVGSPYLHDVTRYVDYLKGLKSSPRHVAVAGIIGEVDALGTSVVGPDPDDATRPFLQASCSSTFGVAAPGHRLKAFVDGFGDHGLVSSICRDEHRTALAQIGALVTRTLGVPCLDLHLADRNPTLPGVQAECSVTDVLAPDGAGRSEVVIPACDTTGGAAPCWRFAADAAACPSSPEHRTVVVDRGGAAVPDETVVEVQCVVCDPATAPAGTCS